VLNGLGFGVRFPAGEREFSLSHSVYSSCRAYSLTVFSTTGAGCCIPWVKSLGCETDHLSPAIAEVNGRAITSTPSYAIMAQCLIKRFITILNKSTPGSYPELVYLVFIFPFLSKIILILYSHRRLGYHNGHFL
jgi:hypothetical protein